MLIRSLLLALSLSLFGGLLFAQTPPLQFTHRGSIYHVKFSPSGSKLISYSSGNQDLAVWDVRTGKLLWKRPISFIQKADEYYTLEAFAWSPDGGLIATGSANGTVQLWNAGDGRFLWRTEIDKTGVSAITFRPDGKVIAATTYDDEGPIASLVDVGTGTPLRQLNGKKCAAIGIAFTSTNELSLANVHGNISRWDLNTGRPAGTADCKGKAAYAGERYFSEDLSLSVRRTSADKVVLEESNGSVLKEIPLNDSRLRAVVNSRLRQAIVERYGGLRKIDLNTGTETELPGRCTGHFDLSEDGKFLVRTCEGYSTSMEVTDLETGISWSLDGHPGKINGIAYSPDFSILAVAGNDGDVYLFDPKSRSMRRTIQATDVRFTALAFGNDRSRLFVGDSEGQIQRWDLTKGSMDRNAKVSDERPFQVDKLEAAGDGKNILALVSSSVILLDQDLRIRGSLTTPEGYKSTSGYMTSTYSSVPVNTAAFTSSGKQLITGHPDGTLRLWDVSALAQLRKFKIGDTVSFAAPISNSKALTIATSRKTARFQVVDLVTGKVLRQSHRLEPSYLEKMVLSPNKKVSAVTDNVGDVLICDLDTMALRTVDNGMSGYDSVAFSENSESFFVGGENQNLSLYNLASLQKEWSLLSEFVPSAAERRLVEERSIRVAEVVERAKERDQQAKSFVRANRNKVYVTFDHYGDMSDPGQKRMVESDALNESKQTKSEDAANAVWLRLHNDSVLPIEFPTESMYLPNPKCFHQFPNGEKIHGLCRDREVGVWFGVRDNRGKGIPYGFDFGSSAVLLPHSSVVFPVPIAIWNKSYSVVFQYSFQNTKASENDREMDYGPKIELRVSKATARR